MKLRSFILALLFVIFAAGGSWALWKFRPRPVTRAIEKSITPVKVHLANPSNPRIEVRSQGMLEARTLTTAAAEVAGKVISVAPQFEAGGVFQKGDVLLEIDPADYQSAVVQAESAVAQTKLTVAVEEAKAEQSLRDWNKLGRNQDPSNLVLRKPQLASAKAQLAAAEASLSKARRDLERTSLVAPYDGRVLRTHTDLASFVGIGSPLADFYEHNRLEVRLPISLEDYGFIDLTQESPKVTLFTQAAGDSRGWPAVVVRQDAEVDRRSRSIHLIAALDMTSIDDPLLVPGLFVQARIEGNQLNHVFEIPRMALIGRDHLRIVTPDPALTDPLTGTVKGILTERPVTVIYAEATTILVSDGLQAGDHVCLSPVPTFIEGMEVSVPEAQAN